MQAGTSIFEKIVYYSHHYQHDYKYDGNNGNVPLSQDGKIRPDSGIQRLPFIDYLGYSLQYEHGPKGSDKSWDMHDKHQKSVEETYAY
jgi:hypothetical protein